MRRANRHGGGGRLPCAARIPRRWDAVNIAWQPTIAGPAQASRHQHRIREHALPGFPLLSGGQRVYNSYVHA
jgi:hypothetical protein